MIRRLRAFADTGNAIRFVLSFVLAFALWAWVTNERDPELTYRASQVPVEPVGLSENLELVNPLPAVDISLHGPRSVIQDIEANSLRATVDLSDLDGPGTFEVDVEIDAPDRTRNVESNPEVVTVEIDTVVSQTFTVEPLQPGNVPLNLRVTDVRIAPAEVSVIGVQRNVARVARVLAPVDLEGQSESFSARVELFAVDANNVRVEAVNVEPGVALVNVTLAVRGKEVPVFVRCVCEAAEGFEVVGQPQPSPSNVLIDGPRETLDQVQYIYTTPIDTSGLTAPAVYTDVLLETGELPEGVTVEPEAVDVSVRVEQAIFSRVFEQVPVQVLNADPEARVVVNPAAVSITVEGPRDEVNQLEDNDIAVVVDVAGLRPGAHQLRPLVILPPRMSYSEPPPQVVVAIIAGTPEAGPTTTPQPTPVPPTVTPTP